MNAGLIVLAYSLSVFGLAQMTQNSWIYLSGVIMLLGFYFLSACIVAMFWDGLTGWWTGKRGIPVIVVALVAVAMIVFSVALPFWKPEIHFTISI